MLRASPLIIGAVSGVVIFVFVILPVLAFGLSVGAMVWLLFQIVGALALLAVATWVVANVWMSVQRR